jgi:hypothetical protein
VYANDGGWGVAEAARVLEGLFAWAIG